MPLGEDIIGVSQDGFLSLSGLIGQNVTTGLPMSPIDFLDFRSQAEGITLPGYFSTAL